jgi:hypothetical protein
MLSAENSTSRRLERQWEEGKSVLVQIAKNWYPATVIEVINGDVSVRLEEDVRRVVGLYRPIRHLFRLMPRVHIDPRKGEIRKFHIGSTHLREV